MVRVKGKYDNKHARFRVKRYRERQKTKGIEEKPENRLLEQKARRLSETVSLITKQPKDLETVGSIIRRLGGGDVIKGWRQIREWERDLKSGKPPDQILDGLPQHLKSFF